MSLDTKQRAAVVVGGGINSVFFSDYRMTESVAEKEALFYRATSTVLSAVLLSYQWLRLL